MQTHQTNTNSHLRDNMSIESRKEVLARQYEEAGTLICNTTPNPDNIQETVIKDVSFSRRDLATVIGLSSQSKAMDDAIAVYEKEYGSVLRKANGNFQFDVAEARAFIALHGRPSIRTKRLENPEIECRVVGVMQGKGGVAKSTFAGNYATCSALEAERLPEVLVIDGDPQGTLCQSFSSTHPDHQFESVYKHIKSQAFIPSEVRRSAEKQAEYREKLREYILPTYLDNVSMLPANTLDSNLDSVIWEIVFKGLAAGTPEDEVKEMAFSIYYDCVVLPLKQDYDLIVIDSGPSSTAINYNIFRCVTDLVTPFTCSMQDLKAYKEYRSTLTSWINAFMPKSYEGFQTVSTVVTQYSSRDPLIKKRAETVLNTWPEAIRVPMQQSVIYEQAATDRLPIQLVSSDRRGSTKPIEELKQITNSINGRIYARDVY